MIETKFEEDILLLIKTLNKTLEADLDKRLSEYGLTAVQGRTLFFITRQTVMKNNVIHQNDVEKKFSLSKSTVSGLIDRLVKKGLVERKNESRFVELIPTQEGLEIVKHFHDNRQKLIQKLTRGLTKEQVDLRKANIKLLTNNMKEGD